MKTYLKVLAYPVVLTGITLYVFISNWEALPDRLPRQFGSDGLPVSWWSRDAGMLFIIALLVIFIGVLFYVMTRYQQGRQFGDSAARLNLVWLTVLFYCIDGLLCSRTFWILRSALADPQNIKAVSWFYHIGAVIVSLAAAIGITRTVPDKEEPAEAVE